MEWQRAYHRHKDIFRTKAWRFYSGSSLPRLVSDCLAEMALATRKDDVDHWGFVSVKHHSEFEALDSKTVRGIRKIIPADRKGKLIFVGG